MFSSVRDGYYTAVREQRRASLSHKLLKQVETNIQNYKSFDMDL